LLAVLHGYAWRSSMKSGLTYIQQRTEIPIYMHSCTC